MSGLGNRTAALAANKPLPSAYYDGLGGTATRSGREKRNPVFQKLDQEIGRYVNYMRSRSQPGYQKPAEESFSRPSDVLFELWNKYEPLLPTLYYQQKVIEMGDFLVSLKEYTLADFQCYSRYLDMFGDVGVDEITDVDVFKRTYFPQGFEMENAGLTFRALMGKSICMFQVVRLADPKLQNIETLNDCIRILNFLRLITQVILPKDNLCWLVYNGTIHIYSVCRHLMAYGHSCKVIDYLLWASMCMETSVVLLGKKYLTWRTTLYTAICQCYYDCKSSEKAESFARRALQKINELSYLESMSNASPNAESEALFRNATVKMAIMVFKRAVFETRKKPKGFLRPKTRANLKDAQTLPWPRTSTEKLLVDMFDGSAAQFLCIIETLNDTNRRTLITQPPASDSEVEILDVFAELFLAAQEIICGGGGTTVNSGVSTIPNRVTGLVDMPGIRPERNLMEMASTLQDGVPITAVVKLVKYAYCYEQWDVFDVMIDPLREYLKQLVVNDETLKPCIKELELTVVMKKLNHSLKRRQEVEAAEKEKEKERERERQDKKNESEKSAGTQRRTAPEGQSANTARAKQVDQIDDLLELAKVLLSITRSHGVTASNIDLDMVVDATLFLWSRCKVIFQKYQTGSLENWKYIQRMDSAGKWVLMLENVHIALGWSGLSSVDPGLSAEISLRLSLVLEATAAAKQYELNRLGTADSDREDFDGSLPSKPNSRAQSGLATNGTSSSLMDQPIKELLIEARNILELGLKNVSIARQLVALNDGKSIADISWSKELNPRLNDVTVIDPYESLAGSYKEEVNREQHASTVWNTVKDLHMELYFMYHRVCMKLLNLPPETKAASQKPFVRSTCSKSALDNKPMTSNVTYTADYDELLADCQKNNLVKALLLMQKTLSLHNNRDRSAESEQFLYEAEKLIQKIQVEDRRLHIENLIDTSKPTTPRKIPPPPILLSRTDYTMVFKPAPFKPESGEKIAWYRLFGRNASGSNIRVRLNDYHIRGCGDEIPATSFAQFRVSNLKPHERYVFAIAAYTADGKVIGETIGETGKPVLASHPLPVQMAWAYLAQVSYQIGQYDIARKACNVLWEYFVSTAPVPPSETFITSAQRDFKLTLYRLNKNVLDVSSPVLLRMFLTSIFISVEITVQQKQLYCDSLCNKGPLFKNQILRLEECEKMMVALELAGWLNEANMALQAVIQCYGLLAPLLYWDVPSIPVIQILERCHVVLQELPAGLRQRRTERISESLHHMVACMTYQLTKTLRTWGQKSLANRINDAGRRLLSSDGDNSKMNDLPEGLPDDGDDDGGLMSLATLKKKKSKQAVKAIKDKDDEPAGNNELRALEAHMLKLSKQAQGDHELAGSEDPSVLHAYIAYLPSRIAFKEVQKFKRRNRYLEFLVQVVQKAITEGFSELAIDWCEDAITWINRRNETVIGSKAVISKQVGAVAIQGDDPKRFAAAMVEYNRQREIASPKFAQKGNAGKNQGRKRQRMKVLAYHNLLAIPSNLTPEQRAAEEARQIDAIERLAIFLPDLYKQKNRRRRFSRICAYELPWRAQLNVALGLSHFGVFLSKLEMKEKVVGNKQTLAFSTAFLEPEWFTFETAGTLVVGMDDLQRASYQVNEPDDLTRSKHNPQPRRLDKEGTRTSGIERAAAAATGAVPPPLFPIPAEKPDTPRTPRSPDMLEERKGSAEHNILSAKATQEYLENTFMYFKRAIVLAHRGSLWTLLQNAVRSFWNCAHTALIRAYTNEPSTKSGLLTQSALREVLWFSMVMACDHWLDMMFFVKQQLQVQAEKSGEKFSFVGDVEDEHGGSSLKYEQRLDDHTVIDLQFTRRLVLRTMELLFHMKKWERLVDVALRFTSLTESRYIDKVYPLMIVAQRYLADHIIQQGGIVPQVHFVRATEDFGKITPQLYCNDLQLYVPEEEVDGKMQFVTHLEDFRSDKDPLAAAILRDNRVARKMVSVPLDYEDSLSVFRETVDKKSYNARALQHSRRLLVLYLGGQEAVSLEGPLSMFNAEKTLDFVPHTGQPQSAVPEDLKNVQFSSVEDVQTGTLPKPQLPSVISSYEKTIEILLAHNQRSLASQAMHELGNIQYHNGNLRSAYKWWCDAVDLILNMQDAVSNWRDIFTDTSDISTELLKRCGLWGCLLGSVLTSNISQYILTSDLGMRTTCCFLSAYFFKALFRASLPHPTADRDYATYDIGEGFEVTSLVPGIDLLSDRFRADGRSVVAALRWVTEELARGNYNLFVLPLLTLYQYFTTYVCRDLQRAVDGRILKVRVLTNLCLFSEAMITLIRLLHGDRLPHIGDSNFRQVESKMPSVQFDSSKPIYHPNNIKILEMLIDKRISSSLASLYGPHLTCQLSIVQASLLVALADVIQVIPEYNLSLLGRLADQNTSLQSKTQGELVRLKTMATIQNEGAGGPDVTKLASLKDGISSRPSRSPSPNTARGSTLLSASNSAGNKLNSASEMLDDLSSAPQARPARLTKFTDQITGEYSPETSKTTLLNTAEKIVSALHDIMSDSADMDGGFQNLKPSEMEMVTQCKLILAHISRQRHHAGMAINTVFSAMKLLKSAKIFSDKKTNKSQINRYSSMKGGRASVPRPDVKVTDEQNNQFAYQNFQSRARLDARLWLECRFSLVKSMIMKITGMGLTKGKITKVIVEIGDCRKYCEEGIDESEICGDPAMLAQFTMQLALLNLMEGANVCEVLPQLEDIMAILSGIPKLSISDHLLYSTTLTLLTDLQAVAQSTDTSVTQTLWNKYLEAHTHVLNQLEQLGDQILHYQSGESRQFLSSPVSPMKNIYLDQVNLLVQLKLRLGKLANTLAQQSSGDEEAQYQHLIDAAGILTTGLNMSLASVGRQEHIEAEIYLNLGQAQKNIYLLGKTDCRDAVSTLLNAIKSSHRSNHDLGVIRQAYLDIAAIYIHSMEQPIDPQSSLDIHQPDRDDSLSNMDDSSSVASQQTGTSIRSGKSKRKMAAGITLRDKQSKRKNKEPQMSEKEKERLAAFVAVRCAAYTAQAQIALSQISGDTLITGKTLEQDAWLDLPQFMILDLVGDYVIGDIRKVYKDWVEEQMATLVEKMEPKKLRTYEEVLVEAQEEAESLTWTHYIGYQGILKRMLTYNSFTIVKGDDSNQTPAVNALTYSQRYTLFGSIYAQRTASTHKFLTKYLPAYSESCLAPMPPDTLDIQPAYTLCPNIATKSNNSFSRSAIVINHSDYTANLNVEESPNVRRNSSIAVEREELMQLQLPTVGSNKPSSNSLTRILQLGLMPTEPELSMQWIPSTTSDPSSTLLFAVALKDPVDKKAVKLHCGSLNVDTESLHTLHDKLQDVLQQSEMVAILDTGSRRPTHPPSATTITKTKPKSRAKITSPKLKIDEAVEALLRQCMTDCYKLFGQEWPPPPQVASPVDDTAEEKTTSKLEREKTINSVTTDGSTQEDKIPFEVTRGNMRNLERLFNESTGWTILNTKLQTWMSRALPASPDS